MPEWAGSKTRARASRLENERLETSITGSMAVIKERFVGLIFYYNELDSRWYNSSLESSTIIVHIDAVTYRSV